MLFGQACPVKPKLFWPQASSEWLGAVVAHMEAVLLGKVSILELRFCIAGLLF